MTAKRLYLTTAALLLCLTLTACMPAANVPPYLALLTPLLPIGRGTCSGAVISPLEVVTAAHCVPSARRVVTASGQEAFVVASRSLLTHDIAILTVDRKLFVAQFAEFANPALGTQTLVWGYCPYQVSAVPRRAFYNGLTTLTIQDGPEQDYGEWLLPTVPNMSNKLCGGDSGGLAIQHGKVVGVISAVYSDLFFFALGSKAYSVPVGYLERLRGGE